MKSTRLPVQVLCALLLVFIGVLFGTSSLLPSRMASHFDWTGRPDGWMSREADLFFMGLVGCGLPLFIIGTSWLIKILPRSMVNLPHKEYWLAPERVEETAAWLRGFLVWVSCLEVAFFTVLHVIIVIANQSSQPRLSSAPMYILTAALISTVALGAVQLYMHFSRVPR